MSGRRAAENTLCGRTDPHPPHTYGRDSDLQYDVQADCPGLAEKSRAAENTNTTPNDTDVRLVPMTRADAMGKGLYGEWLNAPADPVGIAADTLRAQGLHRDHDLQAAAAVLVALGYPNV